jgi:hypothetical protein
MTTGSVQDEYRIIGKTVEFTWRNQVQPGKPIDSKDRGNMDFRYG